MARRPGSSLRPGTLRPVGRRRSRRRLGPTSGFLRAGEHLRLPRLEVREGMKSARTILLSGVAAATLLAGIVAIPVHVAALDGPARQAAKGELRQTHIHAGGQD